MQHRISERCEEFADIFANNPKSPRVTRTGTHVIDTRNSLPIKHKMRRVSPAVQQNIDAEIQEMLDNGICRGSESPWSSPVILVTKKDGGTRFVIDFRGLNSVTVKDAYPIPNPRDILDGLIGDFFSKLDCCSAYWAVAVEEQDIPKLHSLLHGATSK